MEKYTNISWLKKMGTLCIGVSFSFGAVAATIPQAGDNPIVIDQLATTDNITYLMAAAAARPDTTTVRQFGQPKHAWLQSVDNTEYLDWTVQVSIGADYQVTTLLSADAGESFNLEVQGTTENLAFTLNASGWQRHESGSIYIPAGTSTLRLMRTSNSNDINIKSLELIQSADYAAYQSRVSAFKSDPSKLSDAKYGVMFQYGAWGYPQSGAAKSLDDQAADFDVAQFVTDIQGTGAEYIIWSATWWTYEFGAPISSVDSLLGHSDRTSSRDLIGDIAAALDAVGIDFYLYYHTGQDSHLGYNTTDWWLLQNWPTEFLSTGTGDRSTFFTNWETVIADIGNRYGTLLDGWFFDDGLVYYPAPFESMGAAAKAGNPDRLISYNAWIIAHYTEFEDMAFGEACHSGGAAVGSDGLYTSTSDAGLYGHCMSRMENGWGINSANQSIGSPNYTIETATSRVEDASSRSVPTSFNLMMYEDGTMAQASLDVMTGLKAAVGDGCGDGCQILNNTDTSITYTGSWSLSSNRGISDYEDDLQYTTQNGDYFEHSFSGSGVAIYMPVYNAGGDVEVFIDNISQGVFSAYAAAAGSPSNAQQKVFDVAGLSSGSHTIRAVKLGGSVMQLDRLDITNTMDIISEGKAATQSSTAYGGVASRAVDGITDGTFHDGSVTHTAANQLNPEWEVDLGSDIAIGKIDIFNRTDCCSNRLANFRVDIIDSNNVQVWSSLQNTAPNPQLSLDANGAVGRYVRVTIPGTGTLSLAEVQVYGVEKPISEGKVATQSSTAYGGVASRAVDGITDGTFHDGSVTHTAANQLNPEWEVDLGSDIAIGKIDIFNRTDCCSNRLANFRVDVIDSNNVQVWSSLQNTAPNPQLSLDANGAVGRYVRVTIPGTGTLSLAEVQVYAN